MARRVDRETRNFIVRSSERRGVLSGCSINCLIPLLFLATVIIALFIAMGESQAQMPISTTSEYIKYTAVTGYFQQDDSLTNDLNFDYATANFGLIDRSYDRDLDRKTTQWERFEHEVARLNQESAKDVQFKVLYLGRHGEGYHNVAEAFYGSHDWDCYWSLQNGNGTSTWADALLTSEGIAQATKANTFWANLISTQKIPTPESYYTSPLLRCMATADVTFSGLTLPSDRPFKPIIKELIREALGVHTCDRRSSKTIIHEKYPTWPFEKGFSEDDPLWHPEHRETNEAMDIRLRQALDDIFSSDKNTFISISSHSGALSSVLRVTNHRDFHLGTGQVIPVLVKAEKIAGEGPSRHAKVPWTTVSTCTKPPKPTLK